MRKVLSKKVAAVGMVLGMLITSIPVQVFADEEKQGDLLFIYDEEFDDSFEYDSLDSPLESEFFFSEEDYDIEEMSDDEFFSEENTFSIDEDNQEDTEFICNGLIEEESELLHAQSYYLGDGTCGNDAYWTYNATTKTITITGTGSVYGERTRDEDGNYNATFGEGWQFPEAAEKVVVSEGITVLEHGCFQFCRNLREVILPDSLTEIGDHVFESGYIEEFTIPKNVSTIGDNPIQSVALKEIHVASENEYFCSIDGVLFNKECTSLIKYPSAKNTSTYRVPEGVLQIRNEAFRNCPHLSTVYLPESINDVVGKIGNYYTDNISISGKRYSYAEGYAYFHSKPFTSEGIMNTAFSGSTDDGRGQWALDIATGELTIENSSLFWFADSYIGQELYCDRYWLRFNKYIQSVIVTGNGGINPYSFMNCHDLQSVSIESSPWSISSYAFYGCTSLENIGTLENVGRIDSYAFYNCYNLTELYLPGINSNYENPIESTAVGYGSNGYNTNLTLYGISGSKVEIYAQEHGLKFVDISSNSFSVTFDANGGTGAPTTQTKKKDVALTLSSTKPTKSCVLTYNANGGSVSPASKTLSSSFKNWNTAQNGSGTSYNPGASYTANASVTLYAQWINPTAGALATPTRTGYDFAGWYTSATGGQKVDANSTITGNTTIYAHWDNHTLDLSDLTYSFDNSAESFGYSSTYRIPLKRYQMFFSDTQSKYLYNQTGVWGGSCYGMAATSGMFNVSGSGITVPGFNSSAQKVSNLSVSNRNSALNLSVTELIEALFVSQFDINVQYAYRDTNLNALCNEVKKVENGGAPVILAVFGPEGGHALVGYKIVSSSNNRDYLYVYDCNYPNTERYITLTKNSSGSYTGWYYHLNDVYNWGSSYWDCSLAYVPYSVYQRVWNKRQSNRNVNMISVNSPNFELKDYEGNTIATMVDGELNTSNDSVIQYLETNLGSDMNMLIVPTDVYQITNTDDSVQEFQVNTVNVEQSLSVSTTADDMTLAVSDSDGVDTVSVNTTEGDSYTVSIESQLPSANGLNEMEFSGTGNGNVVTVGLESGNCIMTNCTGVSLWINGEMVGGSTQSGQSAINGFAGMLEYTKCEFDGSNKEPAVTLKNGTYTLKRGVDYVAIYENNIKIGIATVKLYGIGAYCGTKTLNFEIVGHSHSFGSWRTTKAATESSTGTQIRTCTACGYRETKIIAKLQPKITITKKPTIQKPTAAKGKITVNWKHFKNTTKKGKKIWKKIKKVQFQCATDKAFKNIVKTAMVGKKKKKATIKGLAKKTTYYVRVRYYDGTGYSNWSKTKKVKTK